MKKARLYDPGHSTSAKKFNGRAHIDAMYDSTWQRYSAKFLLLNPRCYACGQKSSATDHILPHKGDDFLFKKIDNHLPLCHKCHNTITSLFDARYRPGTSIDPKLKWMANKRLIFDLTFRVKVMPKYE